MPTLNDEIFQLIKEIKSMDKQAFVPSPVFSQEANNANNPNNPIQPGDAQVPQQKQITSLDEAIQISIENILNGADPNSLMQALIQAGVPQDAAQEAINQAIGYIKQKENEATQGQGGQNGQPPMPEPPPAPPEPSTPPKPRDLSEEIEGTIREDMNRLKRNAQPPEQQLDYLHRKVDKLLEIIQEHDNIIQAIIGSAPQKQASLIHVLNENKKIMDNDYEDEIDETNEFEENIGSIP